MHFYEMRSYKANESKWKISGFLGEERFCLFTYSLAEPFKYLYILYARIFSSFPVTDGVFLELDCPKFKQLIALLCVISLDFTGAEEAVSLLCVYTGHISAPLSHFPGSMWVPAPTKRLPLCCSFPFLNLHARFTMVLHPALSVGSFCALHASLVYLEVF